MTPTLLSYLAEGGILVMVFFGPLAFGAVETWSVAILQVMAFLVLLIAARLPGGGNLSDRTVLPVIFLIIGIGILQLLNTHPPTDPASILPSTAYQYGTQKALLLWCTFAAVLWSAARTFQTREALRRAAWGLFLLGALVAVIGISQRGQGNTHYYGVRAVLAGHPFGPYTNPNHAASLLIISALMGVGLFLAGFEGKFRGLNLSRSSDLIARQSLILFLLVIIAFGLFQTQSRGGALALIPALWTTGFIASGFSRRKIIVRRLRAGLLILAVGLPIVLMIAASPLMEFQEILTVYSPSRDSIYQSALQMLSDKPFFGHGLGAFREVFPVYQEIHLEAWKSNSLVTHVHSDWLELVLQAGAVGFTCVAAGIGLFLLRVTRSIATIPSSETRILSLSAYACVLAILAHCAIEFTLQIPANAVLFVVMLSYLGASIEVHRKKEILSMRTKAPKTLKFLRWTLSSMALLLIVLSIMPAVAFRHFQSAAQSEITTRPYYLTRALEWDPKPRYHHAMAQTYRRLAVENPLARTVLLRYAASSSASALESAPFNSRYLYTHGAILWELGRIRDGSHYIRLSKLKT